MRQEDSLRVQMPAKWGLEETTSMRSVVYEGVFWTKLTSSPLIDRRTVLARFHLYSCHSQARKPRQFLDIIRSPIVIWSVCSRFLPDGSIFPGHHGVQSSRTCQSQWKQPRLQIRAPDPGQVRLGPRRGSSSMDDSVRTARVLHHALFPNAVVEPWEWTQGVWYLMSAKVYLSTPLPTV